MDDFFKIIINCRDEELEDIIKERMMELESSVSTDRKIIVPNERTYEYGSYYKGFIKSDVKIYFSMEFIPNVCYSLANYDYAISFFKKVKELGIKNKLDVIKYLSSFMDDYFGYFCGDDKREQFLLQYNGGATIDCFKGTNLAACSERAAITNNVLEMIGIKSIYVTGTVNGEQHAFNIIINNNGQYYLLDTAFNCTLYDERNKVLGTVPFFYSLGVMNEQLEQFLMYNKSLRFYDRIARKNAVGVIKYENNAQFRKYSIEPILLEDNKTRSRYIF